MTQNPKPPSLTGPRALLLVLAAALVPFGLAAATHYEVRRRTAGVRSLAEWAREAVRPAAADAVEPGSGGDLFEGLGCRNCHSLGGFGAHVGPALDGVRERKTRAEIVEWLKDPQTVKPGTVIPAFRLDEVELRLLADFLMTR